MVVVCKAVHVSAFAFVAFVFYAVLAKKDVYIIIMTPFK